MKHLFFYAFVFFTSLSIAQIETTRIITKEKPVLTGSYEFIKTSPVIATSPQKDARDGAKQIIRKGRKITIESADANTVYFKYWNFSKGSTLYNTYNFRPDTKEDFIFEMTLSEFEKYTRPLYRKYKGVQVGVYSVPFRLRGIAGDNFDFESNLSLQANMVFGFGSRYKTESWFDASFGIGVTGVNLTELNSDVTEDRTANAFTVSLGAVVKPTKLVNFGLFIGWDFLNQNDTDTNWIFDGKTWIGLGINVSFNNINTENSPTKQKAQDQNQG